MLTIFGALSLIGNWPTLFEAGSLCGNKVTQTTTPESLLAKVWFSTAVKMLTMKTI